MERKIIGVYEVKEDRIVRDNSYECAGWYKDILVKKGLYPIFESGNISYMYSIKLSGVVVEDDFSSRFAGVQVGSQTNKHVGEKATYYIHEYSFTIAEMALDGKVELLDGIEAVKETKYSNMFNEWITVNKLVFS